MQLNKALAEEIKHKYDTPTFIYDEDQIKENITYLKKTLDNNIHVHYSIKANPTLAIARIFAKEGLGCEVASGFELKAAQLAGFKANKIIFVGPGKKKSEIKLAVKSKIKAIVCESFNELKNINQIAKEISVKQSVLLRINPNFYIKGAKLKMTGVGSQFGIDSETLDKNIHLLNEMGNIKVLGIHVFNGSQVLDANALIDNINNIVTLAQKISKKYLYDFPVIDIGGGLGTDEDKNALKSKFDIALFIKKLNALVRKNGSKTREYIIESGRYLVNESGSLLVSVIDKKCSHGKHYIITDGGLNYINTVAQNYYLLNRSKKINYFKPDDKVIESSIKISLSGRSCNPADLYCSFNGKAVIEINDILIIPKVGAYGLSYSPGRFISFGFPSEVIIKNGRYELIRRREMFEDIVLTQKYGGLQ